MEGKEMMKEMAEEIKELRKIIEELKDDQDEKKEKEGDKKVEGVAGAEGWTPPAKPDAVKEKREEGEGEWEKERSKKRNVVIKGLRGKKNWKKEAERIVKEAGGEGVRVVSAWECGTTAQDETRGVVVVEMGSEKEKEQVIRRKETVEEKERVKLWGDLTYKEREIKWRLMTKEAEERGKKAQLGREDESKGNRVWKRWDEGKKNWEREEDKEKTRQEQEKKKREKEREELEENREKWGKRLIKAIEELHNINKELEKGKKDEKK